MKHKISLIWRLSIALVLMASLGLAVALPVQAQGVSVNIIECPDDCPISTCVTFGIKAEVTNYTSDDASSVTVDCGVSGPATIVSPNPVDLGTMTPGETDYVGFMIHCDGPGDVTIHVTTNYGGSDYCYVEQAEGPKLEAGLEGPCEICTNCDKDEFQLDAWVRNNGDQDATNVRLVITRDDPSLAHIIGSTERWIGDLPANSGKVYITTPWDAVCDDPGDVTFTVTPSGDNGCTNLDIPAGDITAGTLLVPQEEVLVDVICVMGLDSTGEPACGETCGEPNSHDSDTISSLQNVAITASVFNCTSTPKNLRIQLVPPSNTQLVGTTVTCQVTGGPMEVPVETPDWTVTIEDVCGCCEAIVTWTLQCTGGNTSEDVVVNVWEVDDGGTPLGSDYEWDNTKCDTATLNQEIKAHLEGWLGAYVNCCTSGSCVLADTDNPDNPAAVAYGQDFDVYVKVNNPGKAVAEDVSVDVTVVGETDCVGVFTVNLGNITGGSSNGKWLSDIAGVGNWCDCLGEGTVTATITDIDGIDENTCEPVLPANIDVPCPLIIQQCDFEIELMNPYPPQYVCVCDYFAVKAKLSNCGTCDFYDVDFELKTSGSSITLASGETWVKTLDEVVSNECGECNEYEVTWNVHCAEPGDVDIWVCAESTSTDVGDLNMMVKTPTVTVHQVPPPDISIDIISPDSMDTFVATGQEFAVTAVVTNNTTANVTANTTLEWEPCEGATLVSANVSYGDYECDFEPRQPLAVPGEIDIGPYDNATVTWTLQCQKEGGLVIWAESEGMAPNDCCPSDYAESTPIVVWQYAAAHLDLDILGVDPGDSITVGDDFTVYYEVVNTGQADATEVTANLSVTPEGSACPAAGYNGYTQEIGTLTGHGQDGWDESGTYFGEWDMQCEEVGKSTIEITAEGYDEYGWHKKQQCQSTGNFIVDAGCVYIEELVPWEPGMIEDRAWTYSLLIGEASGFIGPFSINADVQGAAFGGGPDFLAHLDAMGVVVPSINSDDVQYILSMMPGGCGDCMTLFDMLQMYDMQGIEKDALIYVGHMTGETVYDYLVSGNYCVEAGYFQSINGNMSGSELALLDPGQGNIPAMLSVLSGTYCSTMAKEALRAIPEDFIEPASFTVMQTERSADIGVTKDVSYSEIYVGDPVTFTVTVTNYGPNAATGVRVTDQLPSGISYDGYDATGGWYDVTSGLWHVGDLGVDSSEVLYIYATVDKVGDIDNIAAVIACDLPDPTTSNNEDMATFTGLEPLPVDEWAIDLDEDYNLISLPLYIPVGERDTAEVLDEVYDNLDSAWAYNACADPGLEWTSYIPDGPTPSLTEMRDGPGYWLIMDAADTLNVSGEVLPLAPEAPPYYEVCEGWNLIGFKSTIPKTPDDYLAAIAGQYTVIYGFANGSYYIVGLYGHDYMEPGYGYWIAVTEDGTIYP